MLNIQMLPNERCLFYSKLLHLVCVCVTAHKMCSCALDTNTELTFQNVEVPSQKFLIMSPKNALIQRRFYYFSINIFYTTCTKKQVDLLYLCTQIRKICLWILLMYTLTSHHPQKDARRHILSTLCKFYVAPNTTGFPSHSPTKYWHHHHMWIEHVKPLFSSDVKIYATVIRPVIFQCGSMLFSFFLPSSFFCHTTF